MLKEAEKGFSQEDARWVKRHGPAETSAGSDSLCYWHGVTVVLNRRDGRAFAAIGLQSSLATMTGFWFDTRERLSVVVEFVKRR